MKKILLVRLSAIGDIVFASTILKPLKESNENHHISWLVKSSLSNLLVGNHFIDEIIPLPLDRWKELKNNHKYLTLIKEFFRFIRELRKRDFDIAIDLHGILKGSIWAFLSGAKEKIGLGKKEFNWILLNKVYPRDGEKEFFGSEYIFLAESLGFKVSDKKPSMFVSETIIEKVKDKFLKDSKSGYFVLAPFTTRPQKHWIEKYWIELIQKISDCFMDKKLFILGAKNDYEIAERFIINKNIINLAGKTSLDEAAVLVYLSDGIIGVDTGLTHMGTAFEKTTIAIFGSTCPYLKTTNPKTKVLYAGLSCAPCRRNPTCNNRFDCMVAITPDVVYDEFKRVVDI